MIILSGGQNDIVFLRIFNYLSAYSIIGFLNILQSMVFSWLDPDWHNEGPASFNYSFQACGLIKDPSTDQYNVLVTGGLDLLANDVQSQKTWL